MRESNKETLPRTIGLLTDFGLCDPYVGQMKAVLDKRAPSCKVIDISHDIVPHNVAQAGFFLAVSYRHFPGDAVILSVVDPGVGTSRRILVLQLDDQLLIAPDNGLLSLTLATTQTNHIRAFDLSQAMDVSKNVAHTFHGRDVFAPLAAKLALGEEPAELGEKIDPSKLITPPWSQPTIMDTRAIGHIVHIDRFGNCVLNLEAGAIGSPAAIHWTSPAGKPLPYVTTYADIPKGAPGLLEGSQGFLEIAVNQGSAARCFGLSMGDTIKLDWEG